MIRTGAYLCAFCRHRERAFYVLLQIDTPPDVVLQSTVTLCPECTGTGEAIGMTLHGRPATMTVTEIPNGMR